MSLTFGTLLTNLLFSSLIILLITFLLRDNTFLDHKTSKLFLYFILSAMLKLILPVNYFFTTSIRVKFLLPDIYTFLKTPIVLGISVNTLLLIIWGVVFLLTGSVVLRKHVNLVNLIKLLPEITDEYVTSVFQEINKNNCPIKIKELDLKSPLILGLTHPTILLPRKAIQSDGIKYILKHEINHYIYHDLWIKAALDILRAIYWWNPLVNLLHKQTTKFTEIRNDLNLIADGDSLDEYNYLTCLYQMATPCEQNSQENSLTFASKKKSNLSQRMHAIDKNKTVSLKKRFILYLLLMLTIGSFFISIEPL